MGPRPGCGFPCGDVTGSQRLDYGGNAHRRAVVVLIRALDLVVARWWPSSMHGGTQRGLGKAAAAPGVVGLRLSLGGAWLHGVLAAVRGLAEVLAKAWTATSTNIAPFLKVSFCTSPSLQSSLRICGLFGGEEEQVVVAWLCVTGIC